MLYQLNTALVLLLCLLLNTNQVKANTEIITFTLKSLNSLLPFHDVPVSLESLVNININEQQTLFTPLNSSFEKVNKQYFKLNLFNEPTGFIAKNWRSIGRRFNVESNTIRICWPASYPTSFDINLYLLASTTTSPTQPPPSVLLIVTSKSTGVIFPSYHSSPFTPSTTLKDLDSTPYTILLESAYLGFLPASSLNLVVSIIVIIIGISKLGLVDRVMKFLEAVVEDKVDEGKDEKIE